MIGNVVGQNLAAFVDLGDVHGQSVAASTADDHVRLNLITAATDRKFGNHRGGLTRIQYSRGRAGAGGQRETTASVRKLIGDFLANVKTVAVKVNHTPATERDDLLW